MDKISYENLIFYVNSPTSATAVINAKTIKSKPLAACLGMLYKCAVIQEFCHLEFLNERAVRL